MKIQNIKDFFKKNKNNIFDNVKTIGIVFNAINHESLMAAVMTDIVLTRSKIATKMIDIRDVFPVADQYLWLESGTSSLFKNYMKADVLGLHQEGLYYGTLGILERSIFFAADLTDERKFDETIAGKIYEFLLEKSYATEDDLRAFTRIAMLGLEWLTGLNCQKSAIDAAAYHDCLQNAYSHYTGDTVTLNTIINIAKGDSLSATIYRQKQKDFGLAISRRCRYIEINGKGMQYLTTNGPEVYGVIRRISLAKQDFCHVSEGSYGPVIYASVGIPDSVFKERTAFNLTQLGGDKHVVLRYSA